MPSSSRPLAVFDIAPEKFLLPQELEKAAGTLDGIFDAVAAKHSIQAYAPQDDKPLELPMFSLATHRKMIGGSMNGGVEETQEMIEFVAKHNILPDVEIISMDYINTAVERLARADVKFRFIIDVGNTLLKPHE